MVSRLSRSVLAAVAGVVLLLSRSAAPVASLQAQGATPTQAELDAGFLNAWKQQPRATLRRQHDAGRPLAGVADPSEPRH